MVLEIEEEDMVEEEGIDASLARSWGPGLGSPTLVVAPFNMAVFLLPTPGHNKSEYKINSNLSQDIFTLYALQIYYHLSTNA